MFAFPLWFRVQENSGSKYIFFVEISVTSTCSFIAIPACMYLWPVDPYTELVLSSRLCSVDAAMHSWADRRRHISIRKQDVSPSYSCCTSFLCFEMPRSDPKQVLPSLTCSSKEEISNFNSISAVFTFSSERWSYPILSYLLLIWQL